MAIISYLKIENFRSIRTLELTDLQSYVPLVGLNSSGKSNILRALNLFFNGQTDETGTEVSLSDDLSTYAPLGKKKRIAITVRFELSAEFKVPKQEAFLLRNELRDQVVIERSWSLSEGSQTLVDALRFGATPSTLHDAAEDDRANLQAFIRAVRFIYVSNHVRPSDLVRAELEPLRSTLVQRLRASAVYKGAPVESIIDELNRQGERMFGDVAQSLSRGIPGLEVNLELPKDFADLVFTVGLQSVAAGDRPHSPEFEGSGAQSFMLLHVLDLADRTRRRGGFGWVQASIWAWEEPESFLHAGLRARFASDLEKHARAGKRQVFLSTHQDEFARVADQVVMVGKGPEGTGVALTPSRIALETSARQRISGYVHPLMVYTDQPIVIVEGKFDEIYLRSAFEELQVRPSWRLVSPDAALGDGTAGDALLPYLRGNSSALRARPLGAPVIVLRDWEDTKVPQFTTALRPHPYSVCLKPDDTFANPLLGKSFRGIERFLDTSLIETCADDDALGYESIREGSPYLIRPDHLESLKPRLAESVSSGARVGEHMLGLAKWLDDEVRQLLYQIPVSDLV